MLSNRCGWFLLAEVFWVMAGGFYIMGLLIKERAEASYIHSCSRWNQSKQTFRAWLGSETKLSHLSFSFPGRKSWLSVRPASIHGPLGEWNRWDEMWVKLMSRDSRATWLSTHHSGLLLLSAIGVEMCHWLCHWLRHWHWGILYGVIASDWAHWAPGWRCHFEAMGVGMASALTGYIAPATEEAYRMTRWPDHAGSWHWKVFQWFSCFQLRPKQKLLHMSLGWSSTYIDAIHITNPKYSDMLWDLSFSRSCSFCMFSLRTQEAMAGDFQAYRQAKLDQRAWTSGCQVGCRCSCWANWVSCPCIKQYWTCKMLWSSVSCCGPQNSFEDSDSDFHDQWMSACSWGSKT